MTTDPIADLLTHIRNASLVSHATTDVPSSTLKVEIVKVLQKEGYIRSHEVRVDKTTGYKIIRIMLKYDMAGHPVIRKITRASRPGRRKYSRAATLPRVLSGAGVAIISTSKGLMTDRAARKEGIGGEVLCTVQ